MSLPLFHAHEETSNGYQQWAWNAISIPETACEEDPKDICLFWVSLVLDTVGFERVHMSTRGYSICAYEH